MRVITGQIYTYGNSGSNSGALAFNQSTTAIQGGSTSYGGTLQLRECPAYILLYQFSPKDTGQSKVK